MTGIYIGIAAFIVVLSLIFIFPYIIYRMAFYNSKKGKDRFQMEFPGHYADGYRDKIRDAISFAESLEYEECYIRSYDGLKLYGRFYNFNKNSKTVVLEFHGYKGQCVRDMTGGLRFDKEAGLNIFMVDHRGHGRSDGETISFGIKERKDVVSWCDYLKKKLGDDVNIILYGASMGAATILMSLDQNLPYNVKAIVADCGYSSPKEIIMKVTGEMGINARLAYPFMWLSAKIYGKFDLNESTAINAVKDADIPILIIHGTKDSFVPFEMGKRISEQNPGKIKLYPFEGADHGMSFYVDREKYNSVIKEAFENIE